ncbi:MAG: hypothetical protein N3B01_03375 [Verrucomicrobiae bacterium]|nr:hypothetical protein [Verrucomicrobiae bacterium]
MIRWCLRLIAILCAAATMGLCLVVLLKIAKQPRRSSPAAVHTHAKAASFDDWIPEQALAVLDVHRADRIVELAFNPQFTGEKSFWSQWKPSALGWTLFRRHLENEMGCDYPTIWHRLLQGGVTIALGPNQTLVAVAQASDAEFLQKLNSVLVSATRKDAAKKKESNRVAEATYRGVSYWTLSGGALYHAIIGNRLVLANRLAALKAVLDCASSGGTGSLAKRPDHQLARQTAGGLATLRLSPELRQFLAKPKSDAAAEQNPLAVLLLAGYAEALNAATGWLAIGADLDGQSLTLRVVTPHPKMQGATTFSWPPVNDGAWPNLDVPRRIAALSLYRNLRDFYAAKDTLFPERTSQLIFFENMMGIFFTGRDLTEEVMGAVHPHIRVVVAEQRYDPSVGTPVVKLPAFAAVFRMKNPKRFARISEEAWQKAFGLVNFTRGQKAEAGMILDRKEHAGTRYTFASFSREDEPDRSRLDVRFNYSPSIAHVGEHLILSSTTQLTEDLIAALRKPAPQPLPGINALLEIDGDRLAEILDSNRETIIRDNMLKKGYDRAAAKAELDRTVATARFMGRATLRLGITGDKLTAELNFNLQGAARRQTAMLRQ